MYSSHHKSTSLLKIVHEKELKKKLNESISQSQNELATYYVSKAFEEGAANMNAYWFLLRTNQHENESIFEMEIKNIVDTLDEFIKDRFILGTFKGEFNSSRNEKLRFFSQYRNEFYTPATEDYLSHAYRNEFSNYKTYRALLDNIKTIQLESTFPQKIRLRSIYNVMQNTANNSGAIFVNDMRDYLQKLNSLLTHKIIETQQENAYLKRSCK